MAGSPTLWESGWEFGAAKKTTSLIWLRREDSYIRNKNKMKCEENPRLSDPAASEKSPLVFLQTRRLIVRA